MKLAILGGSFNPVHVGHLCLADAVLSRLGYDRIILVPAFKSPFKPGSRETSPADRLDMLAASIPADSRITIDDCEIRREGVSYTVDTIDDIEKRYHPTGKPGLVLGDDLARDFPRWRRAEEIVRRADIIIAHRLSAGDIVFPFPYIELDNDVLELSSGTVRNRIEGGGDWRFLVPQGARFIIEDRRLYGYKPPVQDSAETADSAKIPITLDFLAALEGTVRSMVNPTRFIHSRNTAILCRDLCIRFGLEGSLGYLAGIAHDMCKSLPDKELTRLARKDGDRISKLEQGKPSLLHARAAAVLLQERFGIGDRAVLEAVRFHTMGAEDMGSLAKILYIADKIEPSRQVVRAELREPEKFSDLDSLFMAVLDETVAYLRSRELDLSAGTLRLLTAIHKRRTL